MLHNGAASMIALSKANIDYEIRSERVILWLPVDRPIFVGSGGLISAFCIGLAALGFIFAANIASSQGLLFSTEAWFKAICCAGVLLLGVAGLAIRDVVERLGERLLDRVRPLRARRERIEITQHVIATANGPIELSAIQSLQVVSHPMAFKLVGRMNSGDVEVAQHRSAPVLSALQLALQEKVQRRRGVLIAAGVDPDSPGRVPAALAQLRAASGDLKP